MAFDREPDKKDDGGSGDGAKKDKNGKNDQRFSDNGEKKEQNTQDDKKEDATKDTPSQKDGEKTSEPPGKDGGDKASSVQTPPSGGKDAAKKDAAPRPLPRPRPREGLNKSELGAFLIVVDDFDRKLERSKKVLESLSTQLGALARLSAGAVKDPDAVIPRLVELHNQLSNIHHSLGDVFESVRTRFSALQGHFVSITNDCATDMEIRKKIFGELWKSVENGKKTTQKLLGAIAEEKVLFCEALDDYNTVLGTVATMKEVEGRIHNVFSDFSETIGRIDSLSKIVGEFISTDDTRAFEEELERRKKARTERVSHYIR